MDCGLKKENGWFRYRAAAIIVENGCVLFAKNQLDDDYYSILMKSRGTQVLNSNSYTQGVREYMHWLPIERLKDYVAYPSFFAEKLLCIGDTIEHIVTCE